MHDHKTWFASAKLRTPLIAACTYLLLQAVRIAYIARLPTARLISYVPDDAFYYLTLGRDFARLGRWTFDGTSPATGFHLMWGYGLAILYAAHPAISWRATFVLLSTLSVLLITASLYLLCRIVMLRLGTWSVQAEPRGLACCSLVCSAFSEC